ncbi:endonuclease [Maribacter sp. 6B07]|nr:endonuclease [Maribacter sp. 6B07]
MKAEYKIYKVENLENGMLYIGATTKSIEERKADHIYKSKTGNGSFFHEAIGTYGPEAFQWEVIDTATDLNELALKESMHIKAYQTMENGYNKDVGGGFKKKIYQYTEWGLNVGEWPSLAWAALSVLGKSKSISNVCLGNNKTYRGYYWSYKSNDLNIIFNEDNRKKKVIQKNINGKIVEIFESVSDASNETGVSKTCIARCCRGERKSSRGYLWAYE